jgi:hypothetical protein
MIHSIDEQRGRVACVTHNAVQGDVTIDVIEMCSRGGQYRRP